MLTKLEIARVMALVGKEILRLDGLNLHQTCSIGHRDAKFAVLESAFDKLEKELT